MTSPDLSPQHTFAVLDGGGFDHHGFCVTSEIPPVHEMKTIPLSISAPDIVSPSSSYSAYPPQFPFNCAMGG